MGLIAAVPLLGIQTQTICSSELNNKRQKIKKNSYVNMEEESFSFPSLHKELQPNTDSWEKENLTLPRMSPLIGWLLNEALKTMYT